MSWTEKRNEMNAALRTLSKAIPDVATGFGTLSKAAKTDGALDLKTKELVAIGISVADRCEPCITFHCAALLAAGGTRAELAEALGMCIQMGGGPSMMYAAKALDCFDELSAKAG